MRICPEARRGPIAIAAPTSAAAESHGSNAHSARSSFVVDAAAGQLGDHGKPPGTGDRLLPHPVLDRGNENLIRGRREL